MSLLFINYSGQKWNTERNQPMIYLADEKEYAFNIPKIDGNLIICDLEGRQEAALHLRWKVPSFGEVTLMSGVLKPKDKPYNLNVEIAKERLKKIETTKAGWMNKGFVPSPEFDEQIQKANAVLSCINDEESEEVNARWADLSLCYSMPAGETLALEFADWGLQKRKEENGFNDFLLGCNFWQYNKLGEKYEQYFEQLFNYATLPFYWSGFEAEKGQYGWENIDEKIPWLEKRNLKKKGHPLFWADIPKWASAEDIDLLKQQIKNRIETVVGYYKGKVEFYDVINEIQHYIVERPVRYNSEQAIELTRLCAEICKKTDPAAKTIVNCDEPFGEFMAKKPKYGFGTYEYFNELKKNKVEYDVIGIQLYQGAGWTFCRDLFEMSRYFDKYEKFNKPVHLTELGVPSIEGEDPNCCFESSGHKESWKTSNAGFWHGPWSQDTQADWVEGFYKILMAKPFVEAITWWDLNDKGGHFYTFAGLLDENMNPKESYKRLLELKNKYLK